MDPPLNLTARTRVLSLSQRQSHIDIQATAVVPASPPPAVAEPLSGQIRALASRIVAARARDAAVMLFYGAHVVKNGCVRLLAELIRDGWVTHLATQGAGIVHDWEFAYAGVSSESVRENAPIGRFGTWDEVGRAINLAALDGAARGMGLGESVGGFIAKDGIEPPNDRDLKHLIETEPDHLLTAARADLLHAAIKDTDCSLHHRFPEFSIAHTAVEHCVPLTAHPGIGYDIFACHPRFHPAAIGRTAGHDFQRFVAAMGQLGGGVYMSVGSAIASPQVFEKAFSIANNLRDQEGKPPLGDHHVAIVDIQDSGGWDWQTGEPPVNHAAYYLRFCKTFHRLAPGAVSYLQADNRAVLHGLVHELRGS